jgi:hypothetical protein
MLDLAEVNEIVSKAASAPLKPRVRTVYSEPTSDAEGKDALHITVVLKTGRAEQITGEQALDTLVSIDRALRDAQEERSPIVDFVSEEELESNGDTEC